MTDRFMQAMHKPERQALYVEQTVRLWRLPEQQQRGSVLKPREQDGTPAGKTGTER